MTGTEFNEYLQQRSEYTQEKIKEAKIDAYKEMKDDIVKNCKIASCDLFGMKILTLEAVRNIVDDLMETYLDVYGEEYNGQE